ncbi:MAG: hypothetical protein J0I14_11240 [Propionibacteriaceae bacterium]|jgi:hypothetical protein|nr:hypothetical protein [Propionibacteriaceae bacterium]
MIRYELPTVDDLLRLGEPTTNAVTIYLPTDPTPAGRELAATSAKSAVDEAVRELRAAGATAAEQDALRSAWDAVAGDTALWGQLSGSLAVFLASGVSEQYVLPNSLERQIQVGGYFDIGQLARSITSPQSAYALTLSSSGWNLWEASATTRATELELGDEYADDAADATNRMTIRGRQHLRRLVGDEGKKVLLDRYAQVVADAVRSELGRLDPNAVRPLFVFATEPLLGMIQAQGLPWEVVDVPGSPDDLRPDQIDEAIRSRIGGLNASRVSARADAIGAGFASGLAVTDLAQAAKAAAAGAVEVLIYDFTVDILGAFDDATGDITFDEAGYDLLSRLAVKVLATGGEVIAVRPEEVSAEIWNGRLLAGLRFPLAGQASAPTT